jgi:PAS domain S-box-containing protein
MADGLTSSFAAGGLAPLVGWAYVLPDIAAWVALLAVSLVLAAARGDYLSARRARGLFAAFTTLCVAGCVAEMSLPVAPGRTAPAAVKLALVAVSWATLAVLLRLALRAARAAAELKASEARFRAFMDHSPAVAWIKDEAGRYVYLSRAFEEWHRVRQADWAGRTDDDVWPADVAALLRENDRTVLATGRPLQATERVVGPDGTARECLVWKFPFVQADGRRFVGGTAMDVTDRRRVQDALRESREQFRRLVENSPIGIYRTTPDGRILMANPAAVRMSGATSFEELAARNLESDGPHGGYTREEFRRQLERDGEVLGLEVEWAADDGRRLVVRENARVVRGPDGGVQYYEGTLEDVTAHRRAERRAAVYHVAARELAGAAGPVAAMPAVLRAVAGATGWEAGEFWEVGADAAGLRRVADWHAASAARFAEQSRGVRFLRGAGLPGRAWEAGESIVVADLGADPAFLRRAEAAAAGLRAAVAHPVKAEGRVLGVVTFLFGTPGRPTPENLDLLATVAGQVGEAVARRQTEETFRVLFEQSSDAHLVFDEIDGIIDCNPAAVRMLRCRDKSELLALHPAVLSPEFQPDGRRSLEKCVEMDATARRRGSHRFDWTHTRRDGEDFPCEVTLTPVALHGRSVLLVVWHDLTERKRAEDALRASDERFRSFMDHLPLGAWAADPAGRVVLANRRLGGLLGIDTTRLVGRSREELHPSQVAGAHAANDQRVLATGEPVELEEQFVRPDGSPGVALVVKFPIRGPGGADLVGGVALDVTDRRRSENALRYQTALLQSLSESGTDGILVVSPEPRILSYNRNFLHVWDIPAETAEHGEEEMLRAATERVADPPGFLTRVREIYADPDAVATDEVLLKDGRVLERVTGPVRGADGWHYGRVWYFRDVTARRRAEDALRASEAQNRKLALVASGTDNAVVITDPAGRIEWVNDGFTRMCGYTLVEVAGRKPRDVLHGPDTDARTAGHMGEQVRRGEGFTAEVLNYAKGGRPYWVMIDARPVFDEDGALIHFVAVERDVTAARAAADELRRAKEAAEAANRAKGDFLANVSHELRTPLNGILGMTDLVLGGDLPPGPRGQLGLVRESADTLLTLVNDLLDVAKIEAGKFDLSAVRFDVPAVVGRALRGLAGRAYQKGLALDCDIAPDVPAEAVGDPDRLSQVLTNLVGNAVKFTERGGVTVSVRVADRGGGGVTLAFAVADTGVGIPGDRLDAIFRPFEQADGGTTRRFGGTGLGLSIVDRLTRMMGGGVGVESEPGRGSTFTATARFGVAPATAGAWVPAVALGTRVLVAGPDGPARDVTARLLTGWGMRPEPADTAAVAEAQLASGRCGLVILDDPDRAGWCPTETARGLVAAGRAGAPVLLLHRHPEGVPVRWSGVAGAVVRPYTPPELLEAVAAVLDRTAAPEKLGRTPPPSAAGVRALRLLLAEDNRVNQLVAEGLLGRAGHVVETVADGAAAVAAWEAGTFDAVLMDVQMPVMGGFEATAEIRAREQAGRGKRTRTPVVAMTARAMAGDESECLRAGMDAYVPKPLDPARLLRVLADLTGVRPVPAPGRPLEYDLSWVPEDFRAELIECFLADIPGALAEVRAAVAAEDPAAVDRTAHRLVGLVGHFRVATVLDAARRLEKLGRGKDLTTAGEALAAVEAEVGRLVAVLRAAGPSEGTA